MPWIVPAQGGGRLTSRQDPSSDISFYPIGTWCSWYGRPWCSISAGSATPPLLWATPGSSPPSPQVGAAAVFGLSLLTPRWVQGQDSPGWGGPASLPHPSFCTCSPQATCKSSRSAPLPCSLQRVPCMKPPVLAHLHPLLSPQDLVPQKISRGTELAGLQAAPSCLRSLHPQNRALPVLGCVPVAADAHPGPRLNAGVAGEQTRLSAPPAPHSARLVCPKSLPLNLPLSAPCSPRE